MDDGAWILQTEKITRKNFSFRNHPKDWIQFYEINPNGMRFRFIRIRRKTALFCRFPKLSGSNTALYRLTWLKWIEFIFEFFSKALHNFHHLNSSSGSTIHWLFFLNSKSLDENIFRSMNFQMNLNSNGWTERSINKL